MSSPTPSVTEDGCLIIEGELVRLNEKTVLIEQANFVKYSIKYQAYLKQHPETRLSHFSYKGHEFRLFWLASYRYTLKVRPALVGESGYQYRNPHVDLVAVINAEPIRPLNQSLLLNCMKLYTTGTFETADGQYPLFDKKTQKRRVEQDFTLALRKQIRTCRIFSMIRNITLEDLLRRTRDRAAAFVDRDLQRFMIGVVGYPYYFGGLYAAVTTPSPADGFANLEHVLDEFDAHNGSLPRHVPRVVSEREQEKLDEKWCASDDVCLHGGGGGVAKATNDDSDEEQLLEEWDEMYIMYDSDEFNEHQPGSRYDGAGFNPHYLDHKDINYIADPNPNGCFNTLRTEHWRKVDYRKRTYKYMRRLMRYDELFTLMSSIVGYPRAFRWIAQCDEAHEFGFSFRSKQAMDSYQLVGHTHCRQPKENALLPSGYAMTQLTYMPTAFELLRFFQWSPLLLILTPDTVMKVDVKQQRFQQFETMAGVAANSLFPLSFETWAGWAHHHPMWRVWQRRMEFSMCQLDLAFYDDMSTCGLANRHEDIDRMPHEEHGTGNNPVRWYTEAMPCFSKLHMAQLRRFFDTLVNDPYCPTLRQVCQRQFDSLHALRDYWESIQTLSGLVDLVKGSANKVASIVNPCALLYQFTDLLRAIVHLPNGEVVMMKDLEEAHFVLYRTSRPHCVSPQPANNTAGAAAMLSDSDDEDSSDDESATAWKMASEENSEHTAVAIDNLIESVMSSEGHDDDDDDVVWTLQWVLVTEADDMFKLNQLLDSHQEHRKAYDATAAVGANLLDGTNMRWLERATKLAAVERSSVSRGAAACIDRLFRTHVDEQLVETLDDNKRLSARRGARRPQVVVVREDVPAPYGNRQALVERYLVDRVGEDHIFQPRLSEVLRLGVRKWMHRIKKHSAAQLAQMKVMWVSHVEHWPLRYLHALLTYDELCPPNVKHVILHGHAFLPSDTLSSHLLFSRKLDFFEPLEDILPADELDIFRAALRDTIERRVTVFEYGETKRRDILNNGVFRLPQWFQAQVSRYVSQSDGADNRTFCVHPINVDAPRKRLTWRVFTGSDADTQFVDQHVFADIYSWWPREMCQFLYLNEVGESIHYTESFKRHRLDENQGHLYGSPHTAQPATARLKDGHARIPYTVSNSLAIDRWRQHQLDHVVCFVTRQWTDAQLIKAVNLTRKRCFFITEHHQWLQQRLARICHG